MDKTEKFIFLKFSASSNVLYENILQKYEFKKDLNPENDIFDTLATDLAINESNFTFACILISADCRENSFKSSDNNDFSIENLFEKFSSIKMPILLVIINEARNLVDYNLFNFSIQCTKIEKSNICAFFISFDVGMFEIIVENFRQSIKNKQDGTPNITDEKVKKRKLSADDYNSKDRPNSPNNPTDNKIKKRRTSNSSNSNGSEIDEKENRIISNGKCVIVSYDTNWKVLTKPEGIHNDATELQKTFKKIGCSVFQKTNLKLDDFDEQFSDGDEFDCFILFLIAPCKNGFLVSQSSQFEIKKLIKKMDTMKLKTKPKMILILDPYQFTDNRTQKDPLETIHKETLDDFLLFYTNFNKSNFNFVANFCKEFSENYLRFSVVDLIKSVITKSTFRNDGNITDNPSNFFSSVLSKLKAILFKEPENLKNFDHETDELIKEKSFFYPIQNRKCFILKYKNLKTSNSNETEKSIEELKKTFSNNKFAIEEKEVKNYIESLNIIGNDLSASESKNNQDNAPYDCFFLFIFTNEKFDAETEFTRERILEYFKNNQSLNGKPKFIFIQNALQPSIELDRNTINAINNKSKPQSLAKSKITISECADFLLYFNNNSPIFSTISTLCSAIETYSAQHDFITILSQVSHELSKIADQKNKSVPAVSDQKARTSYEIPCPNSTLTRLIYLQSKSNLMNSNIKIPFYEFPVNQIGKCIVMNYYWFNKESNRAGTHHDVKNLANFFINELKYDFELKHDLNSDETIEYLSQIRTANFTKYSCIVLCFLSHGKFKGVLCTKDEKSKIYQEHLIGALCENETLVNKPKLIFLQACQGKLKDTGNEIQDSLHGMKNFTFQFDRYSDLFMLASSFPGYYSYRGFDGTPFFKNLVSVFQNYYKKCDLSTMATMVCRNVGYFENGSLKQMPHVFTTLRRRFKFSEFKEY